MSLLSETKVKVSLSVKSQKFVFEKFKQVS